MMDYQLKIFGTRKAQISHPVNFNLRRVINKQSIANDRTHMATPDFHGHNNLPENCSEHERVLNWFESPSPYHPHGWLLPSSL